MAGPTTRMSAIVWPSAEYDGLVSSRHAGGMQSDVICCGGEPAASVSKIEFA